MLAKYYTAKYPKWFFQSKEFTLEGKASKDTGYS
jgi:hypothetical protein